MRSEPASRIASQGLWYNNAGLVQLLGLCPLLAVSNTLVNALGLGAATLLVVTASNITVSALRRLVLPEVRVPVLIMVIACFVTAVELLMRAYWQGLYQVLGIFVPLIVTNCAIIGRAEAYASRATVGRAALDGAATGAGFALVLAALGALRELLGRGTLLAEAELLFGEAARGWTLQVSGDAEGFLLALLPPGAFLGLALLIAAKNALDGRR